ncbi:MAG: DegT/DnrJ/EryC1/StrS family aminotransferase [Gammaproteobacteria bacterium]|nr:DegT/DnrJ/EryC1/StrS family aminotransferase [Gammaproteobacteria bacterium]
MLIGNKTSESSATQHKVLGGFVINAWAEQVDRMTNFRVPYIDLKAEFSELKDGLIDDLVTVGENARLILRQEVQQLETTAAEYLGVEHAVGVGSGTDALMLALKALGIGSGDEVITVAHTFVATIAAIANVGAIPVLIDIQDDFNIDSTLLEEAITSATRAVMVVHMNGRCCEMKPIRELCERYGLELVEDAAQAFGSRYSGQAAGSLGAFGCFSFHPMKILHCFGDGGLVTTNDAGLADTVRMLRNHGQRTKDEIIMYGVNSRLDNLQAAFLLRSIARLDGEIERRREIASRYHHGLEGMAGVDCPEMDGDGHFDVFSSYVIRSRKRDHLSCQLRAKGIEVFSHWPVPNHHQPALGLTNFKLPVTEKMSKEVLSLPVHGQLSNDQVDYVIEAIRDGD